MRFRTLEIRWHDSKPISTCDFQPASFKKARPAAGQEKNFATQSYRLATGGEDNHVRVWMVHPNIRPPTLVKESDPAANAPRPSRVEYLATLSRHSAAVNVVRFSPNGELIASAGDDGMIIIWAPSNTPQASTYGSDLSPEELQHEREYWKPRTTFRCTTMQVYDLAWSPTGEYIIAGSTDNTARIFTVADGKCLQEIAEHTHYVQGVAWDPLNEYIATQSSDRSMHIYRLSFSKTGDYEAAHAVGRNTRMTHRRASRAPSVQEHNGSRPRVFRSQSITSEAESVASEQTTGKEDRDAPLTPASSATPASSMFPPPSIDKPSSRRSSFSGSNAPGSPAPYSRYGRSPSPMPPLPAIRTPLPSSPGAAWQAVGVKLYGDESFTNFFRRLAFSPDGGLLMTPAGQFEDPAVVVGKNGNGNGKEDTTGTPVRGRRGRPSVSASELASSTSAGPAASSSSVYIYSRANFARPPVAQLPGHKKASVAVKFSPILYELRPGVEGPAAPDAYASSSSLSADHPHSHSTKPFAATAGLEKGKEGALDVDVVGPVSASSASGGLNSIIPPQPPHRHQNHSSISSMAGILAPSPRSGISSVMASPMLSPLDLRPPTPATSKPPTPLQAGMQTPTRGPGNGTGTGTGQGTGTGSVFALGYRMLFAVVTMDTVAIYDTQQAGPVCLLTKLHYDEFTDVTWSPDGQCLIVSSRDGYCTLVTFDEILPAHHVQQHTIQLQSIANHHSVPLAYSTSASSSSASTSAHPPAPAPATPMMTMMMMTPMATPASGSVALPALQMPLAAVQSQLGGSSGGSNRKKRTQPPLTPAASVDGGGGGGVGGGGEYFSQGDSEAGEEGDKVQVQQVQEPPKKKRRVVLTRVGDVGS